MSFRESRGSFASAATKPPKASAYGNDFIRMSKVIGNNIQKIRSNVQQMKNMLNDLTARPGDKLKLSALHEVHQKTNTLVKDTGKYVKDLQNIPRVADLSEQRRQKMQTERLVAEFTKALNDFQEFQKLEKEKTKVQVTRDRQSVQRLRASQNDSLNKETDAIVFQPQQQRQMVVQAEISDVELELMQEREEELRKLETDIRDVHQIFQDLGLMIHEQGDVLNTIEDNVTSAAANVEQGKNELSNAEDYSRKVRKKKCIIVIVALVVIAIIIIIVLASVIPTQTQK